MGATQTPSSQVSPLGQAGSHAPGVLLPGVLLLGFGVLFEAGAASHFWVSRLHCWPWAQPALLVHSGSVGRVVGSCRPIGRQTPFGISQLSPKPQSKSSVHSTTASSESSAQPESPRQSAAIARKSAPDYKICRSSSCIILSIHASCATLPT